MEEIRKRGRPRKRWREEIETGLNLMGIRRGRQWPERRKIALDAKVHRGL